MYFFNFSQFSLTSKLTSWGRFFHRRKPH